MANRHHSEFARRGRHRVIFIALSVGSGVWWRCQRQKPLRAGIFVSINKMRWNVELSLPPISLGRGGVTGLTGHESSTQWSQSRLHWEQKWDPWRQDSGSQNLGLLKFKFTPGWVCWLNYHFYRRLLLSFSGAAITEQTGWLTAVEIYYLQGSEAGGLIPRCQQSPTPSETWGIIFLWLFRVLSLSMKAWVHWLLSASLPFLPSLCIGFPCVSLHSSLFLEAQKRYSRKDPVECQDGLSSTNHTCKDPISKEGHVLRHWGLGLGSIIWGQEDTVQLLTPSV